MKKILLLVAIVAMAGVFTASAEETAKKKHIAGYVANGFWDNWEIQVGVGPTFMMRTGSGIKNATGYAGYIGGVKWIHPVFGVRAAFEAGKYNFVAKTGEKLNPTFIFAHPDFIVNLSNWIGGYKERVYNADIYLGGGIMYAKIPDVARKLAFVGNIGLQNRFFLGKERTTSLDITAEYVLGATPLYNMQPVDAGRRYNALNVYVGFTYRFNKRNFVRCGADEETAKALLARLAKSEKDAADAKDALANAQKQLDDANGRAADALAAAEKAARDLAAAQAAKKKQANNAAEAVSDINYNDMIFYSYGIGILSKSDKTRLDVLAEQIKADNSGKLYRIEGFADPNTGTQKANVRLADKRAKAVYDYLVRVGVDKNRLTFKGCGTANLPFNKDEQNRVTVVF